MADSLWPQHNKTAPKQQLQIALSLQAFCTVCSKTRWSKGPVPGNMCFHITRFGCRGKDSFSVKVHSKGVP